MKRINDGEGHLKQLDFEYLNGPTLEDELNICRAENRTDDALLVIRSFCDTLRGLGNLEPFEKTEEFRRVFGDADLPEGLVSMPLTDVDLIFTNLISDGGWNIIDYEWTFAFPIPLDFVIYRAVFYFAKDLPEGSFDGLNLYDAAGIPAGLREVYRDMEHSFLTYIKGDRHTLPELYSIMGGDRLPLKRALQTGHLLRKPDHLTVYFDRGSGFSELDALFLDAEMDEHGRVHAGITVPADCTALRIDPVECRCIMKLYQLKNGGSSVEAEINGELCADRTILFNTEDPQLLLKEIHPGETLEISYMLQMVEDDIFADLLEGIKTEKKHSLMDRLRKNKPEGPVTIKIG